MNRTDCVVSLALGGTAISGALVDRGGRTDWLRRWPAPRADGDGAGTLHALFDCADELRSHAVAQQRTVRAVGVASPGTIEAGGVVTVAGPTGWRDVPLRALTADHLGLSVVITHGVRSAARAECLLGAGRGARDFVYVVIGSGLCAELVRDGVVQAGARGMAGEFGHLQVDDDGDRCPCGRRGCLDPLASGRAMELRYAERSGDAIPARLMIERMRGGDAVARDVVEEAVRWLAIGIASLAATLRPGRIVLAGALAGAGDVLFRPVREQVGHLSPATGIVASELGKAAACVGTGLAAWETVPLP